MKYLQVELNKVLSEYDDLMASKSDLENEIMTYRKLLEGEENRCALFSLINTYNNCFFLI